MLKKPPLGLLAWKPEAVFLKKGSCLALALGVIKFTTARDMIFSHFVVLLK